LNKKSWSANAERHRWGMAFQRLLPYAVFGTVAFSLASASHLNFFLRGYLLLLGIQVGIVLVYFLEKKRTTSKKQQTFQDSENF
jgi:hypothetical protein